MDRTVANEDAAGSATDGPSPPRIVGGYRILCPLGSGGMGTVYEAEQVALQRRVALKLLPPHRALSAAAVATFWREAEAGGRLNHTGLVAVHEVGEDDGLHYIAQELVEGGRTLADELDETRRLTQLPPDHYWVEGRRFLAIAEALDEAHRAGVIHRDIKPGNILLTPGGEPKVGDFGIARLDEGTGSTRTGEVAGTPCYMAPEQVRGERTGNDPRGDVFSLGATLYEALTLTRAFDGDTAPQIMDRILHDDPVDPRRLRSHVPADLAAICLKALEKRPDRRYPNMAELVADLRRFLDHRPVVARPPGPWTRGTKWMRRHPVASTAVALVSVALVVVSVLALQIRRQNEALAVEAATSRAALEFVVDLFRATDPAEARGSTVTVEEVLDRGAGRIADDFADQPEVQARLLDVVGGVYLSLGDFEEAEPALERSLELRRERLGASHPDTLASVHALGELRRYQGRTDEAEALYGEALAGRTAGLGGEHADTLATRDARARLHTEQARYEEAEAEALDVRRIRERVLDEGDPDRLASLHTLGLLYWRQGRYDEAEPLFVRALEERRLRLGSDHPEVVPSLNDLALVRLEMGRYEEAEAGFAEAIATGEALLGGDHPHTLASRANLAALYADQGRYDEAAALHLDVLGAKRRLLGEEHPSTQTTVNNLANVHLRRGDLAAAEPLFLQGLDVARRTLGDDHPDTLVSLNNVAVLYRNQGRHLEAEPLFHQVIEGRRRVLGDDHPDTYRAVVGLGLMHYRRGDLATAEPLLAEALEGRRRVLGLDHPSTLSTAGTLADLYLQQGRPEQALPVLEDVARRQCETLGADHTATRETLGRMEQAFRATGEEDSEVSCPAGERRGGHE